MEQEVYFKTSYILVTMITKNNKKLYFTDKGNGYGWTFYKSNALWFDTETNAQDFCKNYFKNFSKYNFEKLETYI